MKKSKLLAMILILAFMFGSFGFSLMCSAQTSSAVKTKAKPAKTAKKKTSAKTKTIKKSAKKISNKSKAKPVKTKKQAAKKPAAKKAKKAKKANTVSKQKAPSKAVTSLEGPVGVWLSNGHTQFRVVKTEYASANPKGQSAPDGAKWFVVTVELKNGDPFTATYGSDFHRAMVIDAKKVYYVENVAKKPSNWAENDDKFELMTDESFQTDYVFSIPNEAVPVRFLFDVSSADKYPVMKVNLK